jgi:hypothetical protein
MEIKSTQVILNRVVKISKDPKTNSSNSVSQSLYINLSSILNATTNSHISSQHSESTYLPSTTSLLSPHVNANTFSSILNPQLSTSLISLLAPSRRLNGKWSKEEDERLFNATQLFGEKNWSGCSKFVQTRTAKQCRDRWFHGLNPIFKNVNFDPTEDEIIITQRNIYGNK